MTEGTTGNSANGAAPAGGPAGRDPSGARGPSKFMADLTKAMQAAAESAREESMGRLQAEAKAAIEQIHTRAATESTDLRRQADDDVSAIRDWSKLEIARIREETDEKIADRKRRLETEIEDHAGLIERQIERVQGQVNGYETDVAEFFERLLGEEDPSRFASMAGHLPEPPTLDITQSTWAEARRATNGPAAPAAPTASQPGMNAPFAPAASGAGVATREPSPAPEVPPMRQPEPAWQPEPAPAPTAPLAPSVADREAQMAAIQAAAQAAEAAAWGDARNGSKGATDYANRSFAAETPAPPQEPVASEWGDPRLAALRMSPDFAAAEAEAAFAAGSADAGEEIPTIGDDALAARLAGLVGTEPEEHSRAVVEPNATQVVVTGLISVASIASFKRHLGRLPGVQAVGVSSGPDGEFVFAVRHGPEVALKDAITALPSFQARVTGSSEGNIQVAARDPEA